MTHLATWLGLLGGLVVYRLLFPTTTSVMEHAFGVYYAGAALLLHWLLTKTLGRGKPASTKEAVPAPEQKAGEAW